MRNGVCSTQVTQERPIKDRGYSYWPTNGESIGLHGQSKQEYVQILEKKLWATPTANIWKEVGANTDWEMRDKNRISNLAVQAQFWPTPIGTDALGARRKTARKPHWKSKDGTSLTDASLLHETTVKDGENGVTEAFLNPLFVETLMGLPIGWTDFAPLETQ